MMAVLESNQVSNGIIDPPRIMEQFEGDLDLLQEVIELFLRDCPIRLGEMRDAIASGDSATLLRAAHSVKGSAAIFSATAAVDAALRLENLARDGDLSQAQDAFVAVERELDRLTPALKALAQEC
jgi:HPt (histidine-containing phosphotransfer) domain-containing protein